MATPIYLQAKDIMISDAKTARSCLSDAVSSMSKVEKAVSGWDLYIDAAADGFVFMDSKSEIISCLSVLRAKQDQLESLVSVLQTGTDKIEEADASFKDEITDPSFWERLVSAVGRAVSNNNFSRVNSAILGIVWLCSLFDRNESTKNAITYQHIIDEFDWSRTNLSDEDLKKIIETERKLAEMRGEKLTDQRIRERLQAVYDEQTKKLSAYEKYRAETEKITQRVPIGQKLETERSGWTLCTYSATTTLLQRRQAAEGKKVTFTFGDVHKTNGGSGQVDDDGIWPNSSFAFDRKYTTGDGSSYVMDYIMGSISSSQIVELLNNHPEGIMIYSPSGGGYKHAIVITDYEVLDDGGVQFYADDPVNDAGSCDNNNKIGRVKMEETWLYKMNKDIFGSAITVAYLK